MFEQMTSPRRVVTHWPLPQTTCPEIVVTTDPNRYWAQYTLPYRSAAQGPTPQVT
jgi:hypothetical protein